MTFFESLLALLLAAIVLLQFSRHLSLPYPAMLAAAGVVVALIPGAPAIPIDPHTALALFLAPTLFDAAFDFPVGAARKLWGPLVAFAVVAVLVTASAVAWIGWAVAGLPIAAAVVLGAIVAPPDAAAATAVLSGVSIPRSSDAVLRGESLFNDATALLLFTAALSVQSGGGFTLPVDLELGLAAPGGILFGIGCAMIVRRTNRHVVGTLGGSLLQFVQVFLVWIIADRLHLSAVLATVACAMTVARSTEINASARMRVHSYAVWSTVVFLLNVLAFLLMGLQARLIAGRMHHAEFMDALGFAGLVVAATILTRFAVVIGYNRFRAWRRRGEDDAETATIGQAVLVSWSGMRGLVTLATAFALPADFPQRDTVMLAAFTVVMVSLVVQGLTLAPLIRWLGLDQQHAYAHDLAVARRSIAEAALATLDDKDGVAADALRHSYEAERQAAEEPPIADPLHRRRTLGLAAVKAERQRLEDLHDSHRIGAETYLQVQEEIDWRTLVLLPDEKRRVEES
ncbi:cation:proton antiporter [Sphingomonas sp. CROZ-RG-20F-R02-07]|uniref:cation:proton antiporter n=1 Tax=Sphingomonas sp. CROZ-RG-20F-R02-07 TaxID=2914832 RepID=UPI001F5A8CB3|nr:cation:proton antiporter [Sphingomonas sp. CROZ-RG-20F-R02-07]